MASLVTAAGDLLMTVRCDDDFADRLNFRYTTGALILFAMVVTSKQLVGDPIQCWSPPHFSKEHVKYTDDYCWIRNTYYLPFDQEIPTDGQEETHLPQRGGHQLTYYQWTPLVLLLQALMFYIPFGIWQSFGDNSGIDVGNFIETTQLVAAKQMESEVRDKIIRKVVRQTDRYLNVYNKSLVKLPWRGGLRNTTVNVQHLCRSCCFMFGRHRTNYLVTLYMFVKALYIVNAVGQLFVLNAFLGNAFQTYGIDVLRAVASGEDWTASPRFPRVTMCDLRVRRLGNLHRYTVQCVLPINLFNEKIYLFLWFWLVFVAAVTCVTFVSWLLRIVVSRDRRRYVRRYLNLAGSINVNERFDMAKALHFTENYLRQDGVFLLRMVTAAANGLTAVDLTGALWNYYWKMHPEVEDELRNKHREQERDEDEAPYNYPESPTLPLKLMNGPNGMSNRRHPPMGRQQRIDEPDSATGANDASNNNKPDDFDRIDVL